MFLRILSTILSEFQTVWNQVRPDILSALSNCYNGIIGMCYSDRLSIKRAKGKKAQNPKERRVKEKRSRHKKSVPLKILQRYGKNVFHEKFNF